MIDLLEFQSENGVKGRKVENLRKIIRFLSRHREPLTIPEIASFINVSIPVCTSLIKELVGQKHVTKQGKKSSENGRKPFVYSLIKNNFNVVGVEILSKFIQLSIFNIDLDLIYTITDRKFKLLNNEEDLNNISSFIEKSLLDSGVEKNNIIGIGVGIQEVTRNFDKKPSGYFLKNVTVLKNHLESNLNLSVIVDMDTRTIGVAEQILGKAKGVDNVLVVKVSRDLGLSIISDRHIIKGSHGVAGRINHIYFKKGIRPCDCGKIGCLGTEIGGNALLNDLESAVSDGEVSIYFKKSNLSDYKYHDILDAVLKGDELSIKLIQNQGFKLGKALGNIMNLLDPELVIIGGEYVMVKDFFIDPLKMGIIKTNQFNAAERCKVIPSTLGRYLGAKAGACMLLKASGMIDF